MKRHRRLTASISRFLPLIVGFSLCVPACNSVPIDALEKSFSMRVEQRAGTSEKVKIDFLWVIDNSTSMCEEQVALTRSFSEFTDKLQTAFEIDARVAVTTADAQCDPSNPEIGASQGRLNTEHAENFPPSCYTKLIHPCQSDEECASLGDGQWKCNAAQSELCTENPNGTVNSYCTRRCTEDAECQAWSGDPLSICHKPSGNQLDWGCMLPPQTDACPVSGTLNRWLDSTVDGLGNFECLATVGVNQAKCFKYEQGLKSAVNALDTDGPNPEQAASFLRPDAYLVIIFVSDEDDCSTAAGQSISEDYYDTCALLGDTDAGGPLTPVRHFVNTYRALKSDPARVIVAAIAGDSTAAEGAQQLADREAYQVSKGDPKVCFHQTYICSSETGKADFGSRYLALAEGFGANGLFRNICSAEGIGPALDKIAETIISVVNKVCLPRNVMPGQEESLKVTHLCTDQRTEEGDVVTRGWCQLSTGTECMPATECATRDGVLLGAAKELKLGDGPDSYQIGEGGQECEVDGESRPSIRFNTPPKPGEEIAIEYEGDPGFY